MASITVGVLALQGAFVEHLTLLRQAADSINAERHGNEGDGTRQHVHSGSTDDSAGERPGAGQPYHNTQREEGAAVSSQPDPRASRAEEEEEEEEEDDPPQESKIADDAQTADPQGHIRAHARPISTSPSFSFIEVRTPADLARCTALVIPGGESTAISLIASRTQLLEPLREFVKVARRSVWGTCAGLILLAERADRSKETGQELIGGLDVRVQRNYFGRQVESFEAELELGFLGAGEGPFRSVFIRAPVVAKVLSEDEEEGSGEQGGSVVVAPPKRETKARVEVLGRLPGRARTIRDKTTTAQDLGEDGDIIAVRQGNVFGTAFHPELTGDGRIHAWWLREVVKAEVARSEAE